MNKLLLLILLLFTTCILFAQRTPSTPNSIADSSMKKPTASKPVNAETGMSVTKNISDNLLSAKNLSRFNKALISAGLDETFRSRGPITVFIPDDEAFAKLSAGKMDSLSRFSNLPQLIAVLTYHAVPGKITTGKIAGQMNSKTGLATFTTLSGSKLYAKVDGGGIILVDDAGHQSKITKADIQQKNGLINVVDAVLLPKNKLL